MVITLHVYGTGYSSEFSEDEYLQSIINADILRRSHIKPQSDELLVHLLEMFVLYFAVLENSEVE